MKAKFHPKAYLSTKRNISRGLTVRTQIIQALEYNSSKVKHIVKATGLRYNVVLHHLKLLEAERVATRKGRRPHMWQLTGAGQQSLVNSKPH